MSGEDCKPKFTHSLLALECMLAIRRYLETHPCIHCGESDPRVLDFNHRGEKNFGIGDYATRGMVSVETLLKEIALCEVLCANCHRKHHGKRTYRGVPLVEFEEIVDQKRKTTKPRGNTTYSKLPKRYSKANREGVRKQHYGTRNWFEEAPIGTTSPRGGADPAVTDSDKC